MMRSGYSTPWVRPCSRSLPYRPFTSRKQFRDYSIRLQVERTGLNPYLSMFSRIQREWHCQGKGIVMAFFGFISRPLRYRDRLLLAAGFCSATLSMGQGVDRVKSLSALRSVAQEIAATTDYLVSDAGSSAPSRYNEWMYANFIIQEGMRSLGIQLKDTAWQAYPERNMAFFYEYVGKHGNTASNRMRFRANYFSPAELWHCGLIASVAASQGKRPSPAKEKDLQRFLAAFDAAPHLEDGTLVRRKGGTYNSLGLQIDDIFMVSTLWVRMWKLTGKADLLDRAIKETLLYHGRLWDRQDRLMHVLWLQKTGATAAHYWGRGNGWFIMALTDLLHLLPENHPQRPALLAVYQGVIDGLMARQGADGLSLLC